MPRITHDPTSDVCPDYTLALYQSLRTRWIANTQTTEEEAAEQLADLWRQEHTERCAAWAAQQEADRVTREAAEAQAREEDLRRRTEQTQREEAERAEAEKKKPKMNDFDANQKVPSHLKPVSSQYAQNKLEKFEYAELWYWSPQGLAVAKRDAESNRHTYTAMESQGKKGADDDDDTIEVKRSDRHQPSKHALSDRELTWRDFTIARTNFLEAAKEAEWPASHVAALIKFFLGVENHHFREREYGDTTMLRYASDTRRHWHQALSRNQGYNIGLINDDLVKEVHDKVLEEVRLAGLAEVSPII